MRIVGVHHRTQMSIAEVEDVITGERPDMVLVELPPDDYLKFLVVTSYLETEMKIAMISACDVGARVFLVDWETTKNIRLLRTLGTFRGPRLGMKGEPHVAQCGVCSEEIDKDQFGFETMDYDSAVIYLDDQPIFNGRLVALDPTFKPKLKWRKKEK